MQPLKDASHLYEVEHRAYHLESEGFRISEMRLSSMQQVPWHYHTQIGDTFYVIGGVLRLFLREPKEEIRLSPGMCFAVAAGRPHLVTNAGEESVHFLVLQGVGDVI